MSNWAELTNNESLQKTAVTDFSSITQARKDRHKRLKVLTCMNDAVKCVELLLYCNPVDNVSLSDTFVSRMKSAISNFEKTMSERFVLSDVTPPKHINITIRMKEDLGTIVTESGQIVLNKHSIVSGSRAELIHLIRAGHAEYL